MRVHVVDPSAYTPPYDHALCRALGAAGAQVELFTSRFAYGPVAPAENYVRRELFYRTARFAPGSAVQRAAKLAEHIPDMLLYRRAARAADVVHFQWLPVQQIDRFLLPRGRAGAGADRRAGRQPRPPLMPPRRLPVSHADRSARSQRTRPPLVLTAHDVLPREPRPGQLAAQRRLFERFDAIVVHSEHGRARLTGELGVDPDRVHVIPHGVFAHLAEGPPPPPPFQSDAKVVLCFGLMRPYKGIDVLLEAWREIEDAELWIAGMPRMDISPLRASAPPNVRFVPRFITDSQLPAYFQRADLVVLPYREIDQSGVLFTALAFGKPLLLSDVGGFPEIAATGAARTVPAGDPLALREALAQLLDDPAALATMAASARDAASGEYAWEAIAASTLELYRSLIAR